jgi:hypothetical protein
MASYSGGSWSWDPTVTQIPYVSYGTSYPSIAIDRNNNVHINYMGVDDDEIFYWRKSAGGIWTGPSVITVFDILGNLIVPDSDFMHFASSIDENNKIHTFWNMFYRKPCKTYYKYSTNGGTTWSSALHSFESSSNDHGLPCAIYSLFPEKNGKRFCAPKSGFAVGYVTDYTEYALNESKIYLYLSSDLSWP